jgi:WD40 repeat protein
MRKIRYAGVASIALTCLVGCTQAEQAQMEATASVAQELSLPPSLTPTIRSSGTATLMPTETPTPESTPTQTPIGLLLELHIENGQEIVWSPDSERIALLSRRSMELYNASDLTLIFKSELGWIPSNLNFSHDGSYLAACESATATSPQLDGRHFAVWDGYSGDLILEEIVQFPACPARFLISGLLIFYERQGDRDWYQLGEDDHRLYTWITQFNIQTGVVPDLEFDLRSLDSNHLVDVTADGGLAVFWIRLPSRQDPHDSEYFYWIVREGRGGEGFVIPATQHDEAYLTLDDRHLVTTDYQRCSYSFFNLHTGLIEQTVDWCEFGEYAGLGIARVEISPDGSLMTVEYQGGRIVIWDVLSSEIIHEATNPNPPLRDFAFHPNNTNYALLTRIPDGYSLTVWELTK